MSPCRRACSFALVGTIAFVVDVAVLYSLTPFMGLQLARVPSFLSAAIVSWRFNRQFTFGDRTSGHPPLRELVLYVGLVIGGAMINLGVYSLLVSTQPLVASFPFLGVAGGTLCAMLVNLSTSSMLLYRVNS